MSRQLMHDEARAHTERHMSETVEPTAEQARFIHRARTARRNQPYVETGMNTLPRPLTADAVADRWGCSAETVRTLFKAGQLRGFRVGRMIRIPVDAVEEYECQKSTSVDCAAVTVSTGSARMESEPVVSFRHAPERKRKVRP